MRKNKIVENALSLGAVQLFSLLLPILSLPYLAKKLGVDQLGNLAFALSTAQILVVLTDYGFNISAPKDISIHRDDPQKVAEIWSTVTILRAIFAVLGIVLLLSVAPFVPRLRDDVPLLVIAYLAILGNVIFPQWLFQGLEQLKLVSVIQIAVRIGIFAGIFLLVKSPNDLYWAALLQSSGTLLGGLIALPLTLRALRGARFRLPSIAEVRLQLKEGWHLFVSTAAVNVYTSSNGFFLGMLAPAAAVGYFHIAEKLIRAVQMMYAPISNAVYPHVVRLAASDRDAMFAFNRKLLVMFSAVAAPLCLITFVLSPFVIEVLFGKAFVPAASVLQLFSLLPLLMVVSNILGIQTMLPLGLQSQFGKILAAAAIVDIAIFIPAVRYFGAEGAATVNVFVELFVTCVMAIVLHRTGNSLFANTFGNYKLKGSLRDL